jgi:tRNA G46 methylase TrmB
MRAAIEVKHRKMSKDLKQAGLVSSSQNGVHPRLAEITNRHLRHRWDQPLHQPTKDAWLRLKEDIGFTPTDNFILDSGCGTGASSIQLAELNPEQKVLGVDQSLSRLTTNGLQDGFYCKGNLTLMRAELSSLWRLMLLDGYQPQTHYLLYPNPWPKPSQVKRRWHAHPVFPCLLALGGNLELRCNWQIYAQEFAMAAGILCGAKFAVAPFTVAANTTPFEHKYLARGQALYTVKIPAAASLTLTKRLPV